MNQQELNFKLLMIHCGLKANIIRNMNIRYLSQINQKTHSL